MQLLVVNPSRTILSPDIERAMSETGWSIGVADSVCGAMDEVAGDHIGAVLLIEPDSSLSGNAQNVDLKELLRRLSDRRIVTMMVPRDAGSISVFQTDSLVEVVSPDITAAELRGRLSMIARYHGLLRRMEQELQYMEGLSARLGEHARQIDQEMELAGRLQRDFLPKCETLSGPARFASLFRPASWVSGDIYDVVPLDDAHTGVYVADAVGHGMAAGLLTMFIKRVMTPAPGVRHGSTLPDPGEVLAGLNEALAAQSLPNCQFVTACYGVLDHETLRFRCARGGHPAPMVLRGDGSILEIEPDGGLLGLKRGELFDTWDVPLVPGDKVLMYTDGLELAFQQGLEHLDSAAYKQVFRSLAGSSLEEMFAKLRLLLDAEAGSIQPRDDVTIVGLEIPARFQV